MQLAFRHNLRRAVRSLFASRPLQPSAFNSTKRTAVLATAHMSQSAKAAVASNPRKRSSDHLEEASASGKASKVPKLFPIFAKPGSSKDEHATFSWVPPLGPDKTCLHGTNLSPEPRSKIAAFDLDGCVIQSSFGNGKKAKGKAQDPTFQWWRPVVPKKLKQVHDEGYSIVIISNQALRGSEVMKQWKQKIPLIGAALPEVPFYMFAATAKDGYRKPIPGMWYELERIFADKNVHIDKAASFFVGDAAGRQGDFAGTDRKWALNVDIPFRTPEEYFLGLQPAPYSLKGFHPSTLPKDLPAVTPTSTPLIPPRASPEIVLFVGMPALGKSSFYRKHFQPADYVHVNQDTLKTRAKCIKAVEEAIAAGQSCVVDNTNRDVATRKLYVDVAKKHGAQIRCVLFSGSRELAWHNNLYRAFNMPPPAASKETKRSLVPYGAFASFEKEYEEPTLAEGFSEIKTVNWVFEGSEQEKERWNMWLQIDGQ